MHDDSEFYTEYNMKKERTYHVLFDLPHGQLFCARCYEKRKVDLHSVAEDLIAQANQFIKEHRSCKSALVVRQMPRVGE